MISVLGLFFVFSFFESSLEVKPFVRLSKILVDFTTSNSLTVLNIDRSRECIEILEYLYKLTTVLYATNLTVRVQNHQWKLDYITPSTKVNIWCNYKIAQEFAVLKTVKVGNRTLTKPPVYPNKDRYPTDRRRKNQTIRDSYKDFLNDFRNTTVPKILLNEANGGSVNDSNDEDTIRESETPISTFAGPYNQTICKSISSKRSVCRTNIVSSDPGGLQAEMQQQSTNISANESNIITKPISKRAVTSKLRCPMRLDNLTFSRSLDVCTRNYEHSSKAHLTANWRGDFRQVIPKVSSNSYQDIVKLQAQNEDADTVKEVKMGVMDDSIDPRFDENHKEEPEDEVTVASKIRTATISTISTPPDWLIVAKRSGESAATPSKNLMAVDSSKMPKQTNGHPKTLILVSVLADPTNTSEQTSNPTETPTFNSSLADSSDTFKETSKQSHTPKSNQSLADSSDIQNPTNEPSATPNFNPNLAGSSEPPKPTTNKPTTTSTFKPNFTDSSNSPRPTKKPTAPTTQIPKFDNTSRGPRSKNVSTPTNSTKPRLAGSPNATVGNSSKPANKTGDKDSSEFDVQFIEKTAMGLNPRFYYILLVDIADDDLENHIRMLWKKYKIFRFIVVPKATPGLVYYFSPYPECDVGGVLKPFKGSDLRSLPNVIEKTVWNLHKCKMGVVIYSRVPTAIPVDKENRFNDSEGSKFIGQDGMFMNTLIERMNFTPVIFTPRGIRMEYGIKVVKGQFTGTFYSILNGTAELCSNGHFVKDYRDKRVDFVKPITLDYVSIMAPKASVIPPVITVLLSFELSVWVMLCLTFVSTVLVYVAYLKYSFEYMDAGTLPVVHGLETQNKGAWTSSSQSPSNQPQVHKQPKHSNWFIDNVSKNHVPSKSPIRGKLKRLVGQFFTSRNPWNSKRVRPKQFHKIGFRSRNSPKQIVSAHGKYSGFDNSPKISYLFGNPKPIGHHSKSDEASLPNQFELHNRSREFLSPHAKNTQYGSSPIHDIGKKSRLDRLFHTFWGRMVTTDHCNSAIMIPAHSARSQAVLWSKGGRSVTPASKLDIPKVIFDTFRFFLSSPPPKCLIIGSTSERILVTSILVFTIVITSSFQGNLVRFLSVPVYYPDIDNLKQLEKSPLLIWTSSLSWRDIFYSDPILWGLAKKVHRWKSEQDMHDSDGYYAGFQRINVHSYKYFKDVVLTGLKNNATRTLHTLSQNLITYYLAYIVIKDSPYRSRIDSLIGRMDQSGLVTKWSADVIKYTLETYRTVEDRRAKREKVFTVQDLSASFIVLGAGVCVASVVFLGEVLLQYWRYRKFKRVLVPHSKLPEDEAFLQVRRDEQKQDLASRTGFEFLH